MTYSRGGGGLKKIIPLFFTFRMSQVDAGAPSAPSTSTPSSSSEASSMKDSASLEDEFEDSEAACLRLLAAAARPLLEAERFDPKTGILILLVSN